MMKANHDPVADVLCLYLSDATVVRDVSYCWNISIGYCYDGQLAEIILLEASKLLSERTDGDNLPLVLTARESCQLAELIDNPPPPNDELLRAMARRLELLREDEPSASDDAFAWARHQIKHLKNGPLNSVQVEALAAYFETQVLRQTSDLCAIMIDLRLLELEPDNAARGDQLVVFRARAAEVLRTRPSLLDTVATDLDAIWQDACKSLEYGLPGGVVAGLPESCPYAMEIIFGEETPVAVVQTVHGGGEAQGDGDGIISHITPAGGNVFLDLGFPPDEAAQLKAESDRRITQTDQQEPGEARDESKR